jgi:hypothetical protein
VRADFLFFVFVRFRFSEGRVLNKRGVEENESEKLTKKTKRKMEKKN